jgi:hypothetical protein
MLVCIVDEQLLKPCVQQATPADVFDEDTQACYIQVLVTG